jgi:hypothetical protein
MASPSFDVASESRKRSEDGINPRRIGVERLVQLAEERFNDPAATWTQIAERLGVTVRSTQRWRQDPRWEDVFAAAAKRHVSALIPAALAALKKAWDLGRGEREALEVIRSSGLLSGKQVDMHHSGTVGVDIVALRQRIMDRIDALAADASPSVAPVDARPVEPMRRFNGAIDIDAKTIDRNGATNVD